MPSSFSQAFAAPNSVSSLATRLRRLEKGEIRLRGGKMQATDGEFTRGSRFNLELGDVEGRLDLRSSDVRKLGSLSPTVVDSFSVVVTDTVAMVFWDGTNGSSQIAIRRADGSVFIIPPGNITITGLTASTAYHMLPFWSTESEWDGCAGVGWVTGDSGTPKFCMLTILLDALAQQTLQGREPLAHPSIDFTTAAPGGGPTSSYSGGGGSTVGTTGATRGGGGAHELK